MSTDNITDAELDAMEAEALAKTERCDICDVVALIGCRACGNTRCAAHPFAPHHPDHTGNAPCSGVIAQLRSAPLTTLRLIAALREARRRLAEHERSFVCWRAT